jgi:hypothetical protein
MRSAWVVAAVQDSRSGTHDKSGADGWLARMTLSRPSPAVAMLVLVLAALVLPPFYYLVKTSLFTTEADGSFGAFTFEYYAELAQ